jgi:hypothetical protein
MGQEGKVYKNAGGPIAIVGAPAKLPTV